MEVDSPRVDDLEVMLVSLQNEAWWRTYGDKSDHEEPHSQYPKEECDDESQSPEQLRVDKTVTLQVEVVGKSVGHTNQGQARERRRSDSDKHGSSMLPIGVSDLHETTNVVRVHENSNRESKTLTSKPGNQDWHSGRYRL